MADIFIQKKLGGIKMLNMNLELSMDVDENMKLELLEVGSQKQTDSKYLRVKARFIQYIEYYDDITCLGDGIPNLIKLRELMARLPDTNHGVKNG
jgi:hypothetical protein